VVNYRRQTICVSEQVSKTAFSDFSLVRFVQNSRIPADAIYIDGIERGEERRRVQKCQRPLIDIGE
jgi:hypothetical protein